MSAAIHSTIADAIKYATRTAKAPLVWDPTNLLLSRFTFGPTAESRAHLVAIGPDAWYAEQLKLGSTMKYYTGVPALTPQIPLLQLSPYDLNVYLTNQGKKYGWDSMDRLAEVTLGMQCFSQAQLYETLVDFFSNHLNIPNRTGDQWNLRAAYDLGVIRRYAMGSFTDMLLASSKHPAMLTYLNLRDSTKNTINENYGRELLELHTVGLHYTESDVRNAARALTGRTVDDYGHYTYDPYIHDLNPVTVLGYRNTNSSATYGLTTGDAMLSYLAAHPYTAQQLAYKLCVRFVSDAPSADLVSAVAQAYLANGTKIMPMVTTILRSEEFWSSRGQKRRRPAENLVASVRVLGVQPTDWVAAVKSLHWMSQSLGNVPLQWAAPNGYPDVSSAWRSSGSLVNIWNYQLSLVGGWVTGLAGANFGELYGGVTPATSGQAVDLLIKRLTGMTWAPTHRAALITYLGEPDTTTMDRSRMRWLARDIAALILHSPHHALR